MNTTRWSAVAFLILTIMAIEARSQSATGDAAPIGWTPSITNMIGAVTDETTGITVGLSPSKTKVGGISKDEGTRWVVTPLGPFSKLRITSVSIEAGAVRVELSDKAVIWLNLKNGKTLRKNPEQGVGG